MSKQHYGWWGDVKDMIRRYHTGDVTPEESAAVKAAVEVTAQLPNGQARLKVIDLVFWKGTHKVPGAALQISCSERTAWRWQSAFIIETAKCNGLL